MILGDLYGDGMALWYVSSPNEMGPVFGGKDYFRGLGIFLDTYSNHNGPHGVRFYIYLASLIIFQHSHPFISAMVSDGTLHYDHDKDGTHTQLGGEHTGQYEYFCDHFVILSQLSYQERIMKKHLSVTFSQITRFFRLWGQVPQQGPWDSSSYSICWRHSFCKSNFFEIKVPDFHWYPSQGRMEALYECGQRPASYWLLFWNVCRYWRSFWLEFHICFP